MPVLLQNIDSKGNIFNITKMNPIDISFKPRTIEHVHIGQNCLMEETEDFRTLFKEFRDIFSWTYEEMPGIELSIVVHEIKNYPMPRPIQKKLHQFHPRKATAIYGN